MNILNILEEIEKVDGEIYERLSPRRSAMKDFFNMGKKISLAALPLAMGSMFQKAYGQTNPTNVNEVLNFALALEYLEFNYYDRALSVANTTYIPAGDARNAITTIRNHEMQHVALFRGALNIPTAQAPAYKYSDYDFTANNNFPLVDTDYATFLKVALAFEDTGVRAFKGQATILKGMTVLTTALRVHSVEARHASHIRQMVNAALPAPGLKPWISYSANGNDTGVAGADMTYAGEQNTKQATFEITGIGGFAGITQTAAAESFDETLTGAQVKTIANLFIKTTSLKL